MKHNYTNSLINSTSPYLLQHAHNPVNWQPWSDGLIEKAKGENKLILVSIGYAACHWCHVMEYECFEDAEVAKLMNDHFVCIKVDREERPDVDHYYMTAVQLMQQRGGWPLNIIALPDGRPIWGGTYFPKASWMKSISSVAGFYKENKEKAEEYASGLQDGIQQMSLVAEVEELIPVQADLIEKGVRVWQSKFDMKEGGNNGQPKFPMPVNLEFLLYYGFIKEHNTSLEFVETTLIKMARGGIYDQIGGGFSRYSVDHLWKVPHFEKMLYDNGQLLSIYSKGFQHYKKQEFKTVVYETVNFIERELMDKSGAFYSSLDADSEGVEGKFYVWDKVELEQILKEDFELFSNYYNVNSKGFWEHENYILLRNLSDSEFAKKHDLSQEQLLGKVDSWKLLLLRERSKRVRPGLDDKTLTSWNALVIQGLVDAFKAFDDPKFIKLAEKNATFLQENVMQTNGKLFHNWKKGQASVDGFMEDYSLLIQAFIALFEVSGNEKWLNAAIELKTYTLEHFYNEKSGLFYFSENRDKQIVGNHFQKEDNVLPSSNSVMANNLHRLYLILAQPSYSKMAQKMLEHITPHFSKYPMAYANWGTLMIKITEPYYEVAISGENANPLFRELSSGFHPNVLWVFSSKKSEVPILKSRFVANENLIYVCEEGVCMLPVRNVSEALGLVKGTK